MSRENPERRSDGRNAANVETKDPSRHHRDIACTIIVTTCDNCKEKGHTSNECEKETRCYRCNSKEHICYECTVNVVCVTCRSRAPSLASMSRRSIIVCKVCRQRRPYKAQCPGSKYVCGVSQLQRDRPYRQELPTAKEGHAELQNLRQAWPYGGPTVRSFPTCLQTQAAGSYSGQLPKQESEEMRAMRRAWPHSRRLQKQSLAMHCLRRVVLAMSAQTAPARRALDVVSRQPGLHDCHRTWTNSTSTPRQRRYRSDRRVRYCQLEQRVGRTDTGIWRTGIWRVGWCRRGEQRPGLE